jgi:hypothetical protein
LIIGRTTNDAFARTAKKGDVLQRNARARRLRGARFPLLRSLTDGSPNEEREPHALTKLTLELS